MSQIRYIIRKRSGIYILKDGIGFALNTASTFTYSQTVTEKTVSRKNQFAELAPRQTVNRRLNAGNGSIELYYNSACQAFPLLMKNLDFEFNNAGEYRFKNIFKSHPETLTIAYVDKESNRTMVFYDVVITNMDLGLSPKSMNRVAFGFVYSRSESKEVAFSLQEGPDPNYEVPRYLDVMIDPYQLYTVRSSGFTVTRNIQWLSDGANQFNMNEIAHVSDPVASEYNCSAVATANDIYVNNDAIARKAFTTDVTIGNIGIEVFIPKAKVTTRRTDGEVSQMNFDIKHQTIEDLIIRSPS